MSTLLFTNYNNYYDRIIKRPNDSDAVSGYSASTVLTMTGIDFNPGDDVSTTVVLEDFTGLLNGEPNYLVVYDPPKTTTTSRWFIMDINRIRGGQWRCNLRRDVITDHLDIVKDATAFIEKGYLNYDNPLIFNPEAISVNQIKYRETLLKDQTNLAWAVGYYSPRDGDNNQMKLSGEFTIHEQDVYETVDELEHWRYFSFINQDVYPLAQFDNLDKFNPTICTYTENPTNVFNSIDVQPYTVLIKEPYTINSQTKYRFSNNNLTNGRLLASDFADWWDDNYSASNKASKKAYAMGIGSNQQIGVTSTADFNSYNSRIIYVSNTLTYYRVSIKKYYRSGSIELVSSDLRTDLASYCNNSTLLSVRDPDLSYDHTFKAYFNNLEYMVMSVEVVSSVAPDTTFRYSSTQQGPGAPTTINYKYTIDAPYNMFCIPYSPTHEQIKVKIDSIEFTIDPDINDNFIFDIARSNASTVYDVQLLPYCPLPIRLDAGQEGIYWDSANSILDCTYLLDNSAKSALYTHFYVFASTISEFTTGTIRGLAIHCDKTSFSGMITGKETSNILRDSISRKLNIMTEFKRLCSPNYSSVFEFNAQKNDGIQYWNYECTYKPYTPFIHVFPNWGGLYRRNFGDNRGLICAGQFSMPRTEDKFATYELQNKNYQLSFQRGIEYQETMNSISENRALRNLIVGSASNIIGSTAQGASSGAAAGPAAAIAGAAVGLVKSGVDTAMKALDYQDQVEMNRQNIKYQKDMWGYQLDNIKALPQTLTNTSAFDINNKLFPFVESYQCTSTEYEACANKIRYTGMTVGVIGTIKDYLDSSEQSYIKADIIRFPESTNTYYMDNHMATAIAGEIYKGVYI